MSNGQAIGALAQMAFANETIATYPPCGLFVPEFGEFLLSIAPPNPVVLPTFSLPWLGLPVEITVDVPNDPNLIGRTFYMQGAFIDTLPLSLRLTDALAVTFGFE